MLKLNWHLSHRQVQDPDLEDTRKDVAFWRLERMRCVVPEAGVEPARSFLRGIFVPLRRWTPLDSKRLWSGLSLHLCC